ncbi:MAG TPA: sulfite exporter TauE/SafE family protein [Motiliproteus sp.]
MEPNLRAFAVITDPLFFAVAIPAVLIVGISKGGLGGGLGMLAVPLMSMAISPFQAAAIMLPILIVMDMVSLWGFRGRYDRDNLLIIVPAAIVGIVIAALTFRYLSEADIKLLIGSIAILFSANFFYKRLRHGTQPPRPASLVRGSLWGALAGFTSFSVHAGGPPLNIYLLPQKLEKTLFAGTTVIFYAVINLVKVLPYLMLGQFTSANLTTSLALVALAPIGVYIGIWLHHRINEQRFYLLCYLLLLLTGCKLSLEALQEFLHWSA